jgi:iron complex transport system ATP-binding protein
MKLEVRDAQCGYNKKRPTLTYVNFTVESGEVCCVLGPNGVGKSTLFKSLLGLIPLCGGSILIDGEDIAKWSPAKMADNVAYVAQSHVPPFPYQVKDVVMLGRVGKIGHMGTPSAEDYRIVENAMADMGIDHLRDKVYTDISGGELQLVMIARALAQQPRMLVLDEPTAALDYGNVVRVIGKVRELAAKGYAVVMTTHSPDHAFMCNSNVVLLQRDLPMRFGTALDIITEKNMKQAYGINVKIVEFVNTKNEIMRMCSPVF